MRSDIKKIMNDYLKPFGVSFQFISNKLGYYDHINKIAYVNHKADIMTYAYISAQVEYKTGDCFVSLKNKWYTTLKNNEFRSVWNKINN